MKKIKIKELFNSHKSKKQTFIVRRIELTAKDLPYIKECNLFEELERRTNHAHKRLFKTRRMEKSDS